MPHLASRLLSTWNDIDSQDISFGYDNTHCSNCIWPKGDQHEYGIPLVHKSHRLRAWFDSFDSHFGPDTFGAVQPAQQANQFLPRSRQSLMLCSMSLVIILSSVWWVIAKLKLKRQLVPERVAFGIISSSDLSFVSHYMLLKFSSG